MVVVIPPENTQLVAGNLSLLLVRVYVCLPNCATSVDTNVLNVEILLWFVTELPEKIGKYFSLLFFHSCSLYGCPIARSLKKRHQIAELSLSQEKVKETTDVTPKRRGKVGRPRSSPKSPTNDHHYHQVSVKVNCELFIPPFGHYR
jgi:hypothetical protein